MSDFDDDDDLLSDDSVSDVLEELNFYFEEIENNNFVSFESLVTNKIDLSKSEGLESFPGIKEQLEAIFEDITRNIAKLDETILKLSESHSEYKASVSKMDELKNEAKIKRELIRELSEKYKEGREKKHLPREMSNSNALNNINFLRDAINKKMLDEIVIETGDEDKQRQEEEQKERIRRQNEIDTLEMRQENDNNNNIIKNIMNDTLNKRKYIDSILDSLVTKSEKIKDLAKHCNEITKEQDNILKEIENKLDTLGSNTKRLKNEVLSFLRRAIQTKIILVICCVLAFFIGIVVIVGGYAMYQQISSSNNNVDTADNTAGGNE